MISQQDINKYITELNKLSKKKLVRIIISLTADMSNLQLECEKLKKESEHDQHINTVNKKNGRIVLTDSGHKE